MAKSVIFLEKGEEIRLKFIPDPPELNHIPRGSFSAVNLSGYKNGINPYYSGLYSVIMG